MSGKAYNYYKKRYDTSSGLDQIEQGSLEIPLLISMSVYKNSERHLHYYLVLS